MSRTEVFASGLVFPEAPRWHRGRLWLSDFFDRIVISLDASGDRTLEARVPGQPAGLGWLPDGRLLVASRTDRLLLRREPDGTVNEHADLSDVAAGNLNDMLVDDAGRAYVGNLGFDPHAWFGSGGSFRDAPPSDLTRVDADGSIHVAATGLRVPNGATLTPDGEQLLLAESFASRILAFQVDPVDGALIGQAEWAPLPKRMPDGIALDAERCLWVADARASACVRVARGGQILQTVTTSQTCFACALGGADGRSLFCLTAPSTDEASALVARQGRIEVTQVDVPASWAIA